MNVIIRNAKVIDENSTFHNQTVSLKIKNGTIEAIAASIKEESGYKEIEINGLHVSQGWFDSSVSLGEPGFEERNYKKWIRSCCQKWLHWNSIATQYFSCFR